MPDFRVAETAPEHPKLRAAGLAAAGLWSMAGAFAMRELTDGWVPDYWVQGWPGAKTAAARLLELGLWTTEERLGIPGYSFHDFLDYQRSAASVRDEREKGKERARRARERSGERTGERNGARTPVRAAERTALRDPDVRAESHDSRALTRALTPKGSSRGGTSGTERARPRDDPRPRCPQHADWPADQRIPDCGHCKELRLQALADAADQQERAAADRVARRAAIDACERCDENGIRDFGDGTAGRCTHRDLRIVAS